MHCKDDNRTAESGAYKEENDMKNEFEKAEKLRQCADVSFEEARDALKYCNGDLLDAMVYLERLGHARKAGAAGCSADPGFGTGASYTYGMTGPAPRREGPSFLQKVGRLIGKAIRKSMENYLVVSYDGVVKFRISVFILAILLMITGFSLLIAMGITLFFGVKYSFTGKDDLSRVNDAMQKAGERAAYWWGSYRYSPELDALCSKYDTSDDRK